LPSPPMPSGQKEPTATIPAVTNAPAVEMEARDAAKASPTVVAPEPVISPQMLIKYFTTSTNAVKSATTNMPAQEIGAPVGFTPPLGTAPPPANKGTLSPPP
jgi:hypothetical protein